MEITVIKTENQYHKVLCEAEKLVALDPIIGSKDADRLELLTVLIEHYEKEQFVFDTPDPVDAIQFRMEEQGLRQKDLIPLIGSKSRVSEILSRKRPLTVPMIRAFSTGLGIPLEALVNNHRQVSKREEVVPTIDWKSFPINEMKKRGWLESFTEKMLTSAEETMQAFLELSELKASNAAYYRRNFYGEDIDPKSYYSTLAWTARVQIRAKSIISEKNVYDPSQLNAEYLTRLAKYSVLDDGPKKVIRELASKGIVVVIEDRLPNALIDGAAMLTKDNIPVIGMTLRYDRIDYFWFTLFHELAHVWKHLSSNSDTFVDRIENMGTSDIKEKEANRIARDAFIPRGVWKRSKAYLEPNKKNVLELAQKLDIHPAIIAGRIQYEKNQYGILRSLLGQGSVKNLFV